MIFHYQPQISTIRVKNSNILRIGYKFANYIIFHKKSIKIKKCCFYFIFDGESESTIRFQVSHFCYLKMFNGKLYDL